MNQSLKANLIGMLAIALWSLNVGLIKQVTLQLGAQFGVTLLYTVASILLLLTVGWVPLKKFPRKYLLIGGILMVAVELCFSFAIGYTTNAQQAIEIGMVNCLWPTLTMMATIIFHTKKANWFLIPGILLSTVGILQVLGGKAGFDIASLWINILQNPLSYGLAFLGACLWSAYCVVTVKFAKGINGITLFFIAVTVLLWGKYFYSVPETNVVLEFSDCITLILAAAALAFGYAAWNVGILRGNIHLLTGASYFIPVFSSAFSSFLLATPLDILFWQGAIMVCFGSIMCWFSTRDISIFK